MAQSEFTKENAKNSIEAVEDLMKAFPKSKTLNYLGHFNDILLFLKAAENAAPEGKGR